MMHDTGGQMRLKWMDKGADGFSLRTISFGTVTNINVGYTKQVSPTPIVTQSVDSTFAIESGSSMTISFNFVRRQPDPEEISDSLDSDSTLWSNRFWSERRNAMMDRWQARTNGATLSFSPTTGDEGDPYVPPFSKRGFVQSITASYNKGDPTVITGSLVFEVGTMYVNNASDPEEQDIPESDMAMKRSDFSITMTDSANEVSYPLMVYDEEGGNVRGGVTEFKLVSGMDSPFEYIRMVIPRKKLAAMAPGLTDDIINGKNRVTLNAMGTSSMVVYSGGSKKVSKDGSYEIVAYCNARQITECVLEGDASGTAWAVLNGILKGTYRTGFKYPFTENRIKTNVADAQGPTIVVKKGTSAWFAVQMCALMVGARVWFANSNAYIIDYRKAADDLYEYYGDVSLYVNDKSSPLYNRVVGSPSLGDAGSTIVNSVELHHSDLEGGAITIEEDPRSNLSIDFYGVQSLQTSLDISAICPPNRPTEDSPEELKAAYQEDLEAIARMLGEAIIDYRAESQQSIEFTCRELYEVSSEIDEENKRLDTMWVPAFEPVCYADSFTDVVNGVKIDNGSVLFPGARLPQKLYLFSMVREYPDCTTTYKFGQLASIDLESNNSYLMGKK